MQVQCHSPHIKSTNSSVWTAYSGTGAFRTDRLKKSQDKGVDEMGTGALRGNHFSGTGAKCSNDWSQQWLSAYQGLRLHIQISYVFFGKRLTNSAWSMSGQVDVEIHRRRIEGSNGRAHVIHSAMLRSDSASTPCWQDTDQKTIPPQPRKQRPPPWLATR